LFFFLEHIIPNQSGKPSVPGYLLVLEDIDALQELILEKADINPRFYAASMTEQARQHLFLHNRHASKFLVAGA